MQKDLSQLYRPDVEKNVIGIILGGKSKFIEVMDLLEADDFYNTKNQNIYKIAGKLFASGKEIDMLSVKELADAEKIDVGGYVYLSECSGGIITYSNFVRLAEQIKQYSIRRQIVKANYENIELAFSEDTEIENVIAGSQKSVMDINLVKTQDDSAMAIMPEIEAIQIEYQEKYKEGKKYLGFESGFSKIDQIIDGIRPSHVWVVGAFTSVGKTQFSLNVVNRAIEQDIPTAVISLEMSRTDTISRLVGIRANTSSMNVLKGKLDERELYEIENAKGFVASKPLYVHTTYFDIEKIKMIIRRDFYQFGVKFFVLDYVQNIVNEKNKREYETLTQSAVEIQALARELQVSIYLVSQISNEAEKGGGAGAGFKGTGALEAVADLAIRLKRDKQNENSNMEYVPVKIIIAKNRHGFTGAIEDYSMWLKSGKFEIINAKKVGDGYVPVK